MAKSKKFRMALADLVSIACALGDQWPSDDPTSVGYPEFMPDYGEFVNSLIDWRDAVEREAALEAQAKRPPKPTLEDVVRRLDELEERFRRAYDQASDAVAGLEFDSENPHIKRA